MAIIEPYKGQYVPAESASFYIDISSINAGCNMMEGAAMDFATVGGMVSDTEADCGPDAYLVEGKTLSGNIEECASKVKNAETEIKTVVQSIRDAAEQAYNKKQTELNQIAMQADAAEKQKREVEVL